MKQRRHNVIAELGLTESALTKLIGKKIPEGPSKVFALARKFKAAAYIREIERVKNYISEERDIYPEDLIFVSEEKLDKLKSLSLPHKMAFTGDYIKLAELFVCPKKWIICWRSTSEI